MTMMLEDNDDGVKYVVGVTVGLIGVVTVVSLLTTTTTVLPHWPFLPYHGGYSRRQLVATTVVLATAV